ncbi:hypothetical protein [Saccharothrix xinjiangensis]|uniref:Ferredoxin n=1 Tax=Saccharothrix xinjiangensis TaxID=204798 RepID=A0ABV9XQN4_9PSEU
MDPEKCGSAWTGQAVVTTRRQDAVLRYPEFRGGGPVNADEVAEALWRCPAPVV